MAETVYSIASSGFVVNNTGMKGLGHAETMDHSYDVETGSMYAGHLPTRKHVMSLYLSGTDEKSFLKRLMEEKEWSAFPAGTVLGTHVFYANTMIDRIALINLRPTAGLTVEVALRDYSTNAVIGAPMTVDLSTAGAKLMFKDAPTASPPDGHHEDPAELGSGLPIENVSFTPTYTTEMCLLTIKPIAGDFSKICADFHTDFTNFGTQEECECHITPCVVDPIPNPNC